MASTADVAARPAGPAAGTSTRGARVLVGTQIFAVAIYLAGTVLPYLWHFLLAGRPLFSASRPNIGPSEIIGTGGGLWSPANWLVIAAFLVTELGPVIFALLGLSGLVALVATRRRAGRRLRGWLIAATVSCLAVLVFQFTPLGGDLANWVSD